MKSIRYIFWGLVALCLIVLGLANRGFVTLRLLPEPLARLFGFTGETSLPLYLVILLGVALGLLIGFVWEWLREYRFRADARMRQREIERLEREIDRLRADRVERDEVVALAPGGSTAVATR
ncbi:lipopolysaccharide assembly protein LapA domain-containing protein [Pseudoroseicyclus aestuarii]|uniref:Uncharacterized protein DUF1049 n=1 Tax=Pseudoroseicyclus aestuarii TaxID=1795041 RepID=A0A318SUX0_9RHOB|nr:LapA family protein [Pseudoroseicyclus aestuarii]PYE84076.1 uncharacterized protein DUF1049 [Pseudoroseicyclus aestuarii]